MYDRINAGLDISSESLVLVLIHQETILPQKVFQNTSEGHLALLRFLGKHKTLIRLCFEPTGTYGL